MTLQQLFFVLLACAVAFIVLRPLLLGGRRIDPSDAQLTVRRGEAVLVDVREPEEWKSGVAAPAQLLSLSDLKGGRRRWAPFLAANKDKEIILYCASGMRSGSAAIRLKKEGFNVANLGGFHRWSAAGLPVRKP